MRKKQYGTLWLRFYVKIRFLIILILSPISLFLTYSQTKEIRYFNSTIWNLSVIYFIVEVIFFFFRLTVYNEMRNLQPAGYKHNDTLLLLETILLYPLSAGLSSVSVNGSLGRTYAISLFLCFLIWYLPNSVYFNNRQFLFNGKWSLANLPKKVSQESVNDSELASTEQQGTQGSNANRVQPLVDRTVLKETRVQIVCSNCGTTIRDKDAKFCDHCGRRLSMVQTYSRQPYLVCKTCNTKIPDAEAKFCLNCGTGLQGNSYYVGEPSERSVYSEPMKGRPLQGSHEIVPADVNGKDEATKKDSVGNTVSSSAIEAEKQASASEMKKKDTSYMGWGFAGVCAAILLAFFILGRTSNNEGALVSGAGSSDEKYAAEYVDKANRLITNKDYHSALKTILECVDNYPDSKAASDCVELYSTIEREVKYNEPQNGTTLARTFQYMGGCVLRVTAKSGPAIVTISDKSNPKAYASMYVREGQTAEITVTGGTYRVDYKIGYLWFNDKIGFGDLYEVGSFKDDFVFKVETTAGWTSSSVWEITV